MTIELTPELGVELPADIDYIDLRERAEAVCRSILLLEQHGLDTEPTSEDEQVAAALTSAYAENPQKASKMVNHVRASSLTPASLQNIQSYLSEYGRQVVTHAVEMRHLVTNRLLEESQNPDPRIRIRALELLGKHSDVGLFSEKQEVTITHQTTDELKERLRSKLQKLVRRSENVEDVQDTIEMGGEIIDVDAELGFDVRNHQENPEIYEPEPAVDADGPDIDPENPDGDPIL